jgi:voltage-gated potassium channel Kch
VPLHGLHPRARIAPGHYGALLAVVAGAFVLIPLGDSTGVATARALYMFGLAIVAFRVASTPRLLRLGLGLAVGSLAMSLLGDLGDDPDLTGVAALLAASVTLVVIAAILLDLARAPAVTAETIAGVVAAYLLFGFFFGTVYEGLNVINPGAFTAPDIPGGLGAFDLTYFSFITLTTTGFGDITPGTDLTRTLAVAEAMIGQLFLVTVVARVVSMLGQERKARRRAGAAEPEE